MAISRSDFTKQLIPGLHEIIGLNYKSYENEHLALFDVYKSDRSFEEETLMTGFGEAPIKSEGTGVTFDDAQEAWTQRFSHDTIALAMSITEEAIEDNLYDTQARLQAEALGRALASTKQQKAADVFNNGFNASYPLGDAKALFADDHPLINGSSLDNLTTADLSETALENAIIAIAGFKDDRGILINAQVKSLHIPVNLKFAAFQILKSDLSTTMHDNTAADSVSNVNDVNALRSMGMFPKGVIVNHRFTDPERWFIRTDCPNGSKMFERTPLQISQEGDFTTGNLRVKARERYSFGVTDPRQWYGSDGSA